MERHGSRSQVRLELFALNFLARVWLEVKITDGIGLCVSHCMVKRLKICLSG